MFTTFISQAQNRNQKKRISFLRNFSNFITYVIWQITLNFTIGHFTSQSFFFPTCLLFKFSMLACKRDRYYPRRLTSARACLDFEFSRSNLTRSHESAPPFPLHRDVPDHVVRSWTTGLSLERWHAGKGSTVEKERERERKKDRVETVVNSQTWLIETGSARIPDVQPPLVTLPSSNLTTHSLLLPYGRV